MKFAIISASLCLSLFFLLFQCLAVAEVSVINTASNRAVLTLTKGKKISDKISANKLTFRAVISRSEKRNISYVTFELSGTDSHKNTEKVAPYCFLGNSGEKCNRGKNFKSGKYTLKVTKIFKSGKRSAEKISFTVATKNYPKARWNNLFGCNYKFGLTTGYDRNNNLWSGNIDACSGKRD